MYRIPFVSVPPVCILPPRLRGRHILPALPYRTIPFRHIQEHSLRIFSFSAEIILTSINYVCTILLSRNQQPEIDFYLAGQLLFS